MFGIDDALIGAGVSLIGSLFGGGGGEETSSTVDYVKMVKYAEAAGFNPLTALRNGGAAGFTTSRTSAAPLSSRIADGVASGVDYYLKNFDPMKDDKRELEYKLVEAQLANLQADTAVKQRVGLGGVPTYTADTVQPRPMGSSVPHGRGPKPVADAIGGPATPSAGKVSVTNPWTDGRVSPAVYDAQNFEDRYGDSEIAQMIYGLGVANADARLNFPRWKRLGDDYAAHGPGSPLDWPGKYQDALTDAAINWHSRGYRHPRSLRSAKTGRLPYRPPLSKSGY